MSQPVPAPPTGAMDVRDLLELLAVHPILPPAAALPPNDEALHAILADLVRVGGSSHAATLRAVSADLLIPVDDELARRAQFVLAGLLLPTSGTHYEVLGVAPHATTHEIRKRWAAVIQRYHPDHLGGGADRGWLDSQARAMDVTGSVRWVLQLESGGLRIVAIDDEPAGP